MRSCTANGRDCMRNRILSPVNFCFLDIDLQRVCGIFRVNGYSGNVHHHTLKPVSQALEDPGNRLV